MNWRPPRRTPGSWNTASTLGRCAGRATRPRADEVDAVRVDVSAVRGTKAGRRSTPHASQVDPAVIRDSPAGFALPGGVAGGVRPGRPRCCCYRPTAGRRGTVPAAYFEAKYARSPDPWDFAGSPYEAAKYAATLVALPRARYPPGGWNWGAPSAC